jgi:hypothetical protein
VAEIVGEDRLHPLWKELQGGKGDCPILLEGADEKGINLRHYDGGRDATYVYVWRQGIFASQPAIDVAPRPGATVIIRYPAFVAGTTIIYDVTAEAMQGKTRPFVCDLTTRAQRVYALLPYQIEAIKASADIEDGKVRLTVSFLDARGEIIQAALPFAMYFIAPNGKGLREFHTTARNGVYDQTPRYEWRIAPGKWKFVVRSLLASFEVSKTFTPPT